MDLYTNEDLDRKIKMARSFLDSANIIESTLNHIFAKSKEEANLKKSDTRINRKMTTHYLYAVVFELCIKIIWEIEHKKPPQLNHDICKRYTELSKESRQKISDLYDKQINNAKNLILQSNGQVDNLGKIVDYSHIEFQSLEEALKSNVKTIRDFKYDGKFNGKSSVLCSIIHDVVNDELLAPSRPQMIIFPKLLFDYAVSLKQ